MKLILFSLICIKLFANIDIDEEIEKILHSPPNKRRELMNKLKIKIFQLNKERQLEQIIYLQKKLHHKNKKDKK